MRVSLVTFLLRFSSLGFRFQTAAAVRQEKKENLEVDVACAHDGFGPMVSCVGTHYRLFAKAPGEGDQCFDITMGEAARKKAPEECCHGEMNAAGEAVVLERKTGPDPEKLLNENATFAQAAKNQSVSLIERRRFLLPKLVVVGRSHLAAEAHIMADLVKQVAAAMFHKMTFHLVLGPDVVGWESLFVREYHDLATRELEAAQDYIFNTQPKIPLTIQHTMQLDDGNTNVSPTAGTKIRCALCLKVQAIAIGCFLMAKFFQISSH